MLKKIIQAAACLSVGALLGAAPAHALTLTLNLEFNNVSPAGPQFTIFEENFSTTDPLRLVVEVAPGTTPVALAAPGQFDFSAGITSFSLLQGSTDLDLVDFPTIDVELFLFDDFFEIGSPTDGIRLRANGPGAGSGVQVLDFSIITFDPSLFGGSSLSALLALDGAAPDGTLDFLGDVDTRIPGVTAPTSVATFNLESVEAAVIPLPAGAWLLISGLAVLNLARRGRSAGTQTA